MTESGKTSDATSSPFQWGVFAPTVHAAQGGGPAGNPGGGGRIHFTRPQPDSAPAPRQSRAPRRPAGIGSSSKPRSCYTGTMKNRDYPALHEVEGRGSIPAKKLR